MSVLLESHIAGSWVAAEDEGTPLLLKAVARHLTGVKDELYALSARTGGHAPRLPGGHAGKGTRELLGREGTFVGQHVYTSRPGVAVQIAEFDFPVWGMLDKLAPALLAVATTWPGG